MKPLTNQIRARGEEIEGAYESMPSDECDFHGDGSVHSFKNIDESDYCVGEIRSMPFESQEELLSFNDNNYPDVVNWRCGIHVHYSFKTELAYQFLMKKAFHVYLKQRLREFGEQNKLNKDSEFWKRLAGLNQWCLDKHHPKLQIHDTSKSSYRYTFINYCYDLHKTMEIRVLPAFQRSDLAHKALVELESIINDYLATCKPMRKKIRRVTCMTVRKTEVLELCV